MPKILKECVMEVPAPILRGAILDFEKYPEFVPEVVSAKAHPQKGQTQLVDFELEIVKRFQYTLEFNLSEAMNIRWRLTQSNFFTVNQGAWLIRPLSEGQTEVKYELEVGVKFLIPGWVSKKLTEVNLPRLLQGFEQRAKQLQGR